jgi:hypothetical protein
MVVLAALVATMRDWQRDAGLDVQKPVHLHSLPSAAMVVGKMPFAL